MGKLFIYKSTKVKALSFAFFLFFSLFPPSSALAEEVNPWEEVVEKENIKLSGEWVSIPPIPWRVPYDLLALPTPHPQPELHFSGAQVEGTSTAQATLALPPIYVGGQSAISPYFALKVQSDGTREGQSLSVEGGLAISIEDRGQLQFSIEEMVHPVHITSFKMNAVLRF